MLKDFRGESSVGHRAAETRHSTVVVDTVLLSDLHVHQI